MSASATREKRSAAASVSAAAAATATTNNGESGGAEADGQESMENCGVCQARLNTEREPQLLPCLHSVCRDCLSPEPAESSAEPEAGERPR